MCPVTSNSHEAARVCIGKLEPGGLATNLSGNFRCRLAVLHSELTPALGAAQSWNKAGGTTSVHSNGSCVEAELVNALEYFGGVGHDEFSAQDFSCVCFRWSAKNSLSVVAERCALGDFNVSEAETTATFSLP